VIKVKIVQNQKIGNHEIGKKNHEILKKKVENAIGIVDVIVIENEKGNEIVEEIVIDENVKGIIVENEIEEMIGGIVEAEDVDMKNDHVEEDDHVLVDVAMKDDHVVGQQVKVKKEVNQIAVKVKQKVVKRRKKKQNQKIKVHHHRRLKMNQYPVDVRLVYVENGLNFYFQMDQNYLETLLVVK